MPLTAKFSPPLSICPLNQVKEIEKEVKKGVDAAAKAAHAGSVPPAEELWADIYADGKGGPEAPPFVRMPDRMKSIGNHPYVE